MKANNSQIKGLISLAVFLVILWMGFAPVQLGGPVSYIIINGTSMEPETHKGDLVVARRSGSYFLDQRVVYQQPQLGYVFHRIVDQVADRFILKGDNNTWVDTYQPREDEILGAFWYAIPGAGNLIEVIRKPFLYILFVLIMSSLVVGLVLLPDPGSTKTRKRKGKGMRKQGRIPSWDDFRQEILLILLGIAVIALIFGLMTLGKELEITVTDDLIYRHRGELTYTAQAPGNIYDSALGVTGDPVYPTLTCIVDLDFRYHFSSPVYNELELDQYQGTISLWAEIRDSDGWHRSLSLVPEVEISSQKVILTHSLDICHILELVNRKESQTGVFINAYELAIKPMIAVEGKLNGLVIEDEFQPTYVFDLTDAVLRVPKNSEGFLIEEEGLVPHTFQVKNLMGLFGKQVPVIGIRRTAFIILGLCVLAALYPGWLLLREWNQSAQTRIELQHRPVLIDLKESQIRKEVYTVIDLESMADLRKLADRYGAMILHEVEGDLHRYLVVDEGFLYQYEAEDEIEPLPSAGKESGADVWEGS